MQLVRTTVRLTPEQKKTAEILALEENTSFQGIIQRALTQYADQKGKKRAKKIKFITHNFGVPFDHLTRDDYYDDPTDYTR